MKTVISLQLEPHALNVHAPRVEQGSSLTGMYSYLPEMVPDTSPAWGAVALFIGLAGLKGLSLSCPGAPGSAFSLHVMMQKFAWSASLQQHHSMAIPCVQHGMKCLKSSETSISQLFSISPKCTALVLSPASLNDVGEG